MRRRIHSDDVEENASPSSYLDEFVGRYRAIGKRSVRAILDMGILFREVHDRLGDAELEEYYAKIKLDPAGSTAKKYRAIGAKAALLEAHINRLPNKWTTIYELSVLERDQLDQLIRSNVLHPEATMQEIALELGSVGSRSECSVAKARANRKLLSFDLNLIAASRRKTFGEKLKQLFEEFEVPSDSEVFSTLHDFIEDNGAVHA